jgi:hypothetical protein
LSTFLYPSLLFRSLLSRAPSHTPGKPGNVDCASVLERHLNAMRKARIIAIVGQLAAPVPANLDSKRSCLAATLGALKLADQSQSIINRRTLTVGERSRNAEVQSSTVSLPAISRLAFGPRSPSHFADGRLCCQSPLPLGTAAR